MLGCKHDSCDAGILYFEARKEIDTRNAAHFCDDLDYMECGCEAKLEETLKFQPAKSEEALVGAVWTYPASILVVLIVVTLREPLRRLFRSRSWDFFVSYRSTDNDVVVPVVEALRRGGFRVWIDLSEVSPEQARDRFRYPISVGIQQSLCALIFTSRGYCESDYCLQEADFFVKRFADQPHRLIEISLEQNNARDVLGISSKSTCLSLHQHKHDRLERATCEILADEVILLFTDNFRRKRM